MAKSKKGRRGSKRAAAGSDAPVIENRRARHDYTILDTLEVGIVLVGTEVKSLRDGQASIAEGYVRIDDATLTLHLHSSNIPEYPPAGSRQHDPKRVRKLLAHKLEVRKLLKQTSQKGMTLIPLKIYFTRGVAKLLIGVAQGKAKADKRRDIAERDAKRDMQRAMSRRG